MWPIFSIPHRHTALCNQLLPVAVPWELGYVEHNAFCLLDDMFFQAYYSKNKSNKHNKHSNQHMVKTLPNFAGLRYLRSRRFSKLPHSLRSWGNFEKLFDRKYLLPAPLGIAYLIGTRCYLSGGRKAIVFSKSLALERLHIISIAYVCRYVEVFNFTGGS